MCAKGQETYPYHICDVPLPQCNTGYVYILISFNSLNFTYIGTQNKSKPEYDSIIMDWYMLMQNPLI